MSARPKSGIEGVVWPAIARGRAAVLAALLARLDEAETLPGSEIAARQFEQLRQLARHCAAHSPQFARRLAAADLSAEDVGTPAGLARLPPLTRRDVQAAGAEFFCREIPPDHGPLGEIKTSGSTGEPVVMRRTAVSNLMWSALTLREHRWMGRDLGKGLCAVRANIPSPSHAPDWGPPANLLFQTGPSLALPITMDASDLARAVGDFDPGTLIIYPSTLGALTAYCRDRRIAIPSLAHIHTIGETLSAHTAEEAAAQFGARVADTYSSQEVGTIATQCPQSSLYHLMCESIITEVLGPDGTPCRAGERGAVVVTDLLNFASPVIRYRIGDYAEAGGTCACGRTLPTLTRILGRERNLILMPDGSRHWPVMGFNACRHIAPVRQYQVIQHDRDRIEARLVVERSLTFDEEDALRAMFHRCAGYPFALEFRYFDDRLPLGPNGKFEEFVCRAAP
jgi:phenylacetate-coenzyme A ligase PaaK-like adenylate-forming protein